jgi:predicted ATPase/DNA-binding SARP family transcriptional activator
MSELNLFLFGPPRVELDGAPVEVRRRKALALMAYLAVSEQVYSRDALATLFWPDHSHSRARAYLRRSLSVLNTSPVGEWLDVDRETVELRRGLSLTDSGRTLWVDVAQFGQLLSVCRGHDHPPEGVCPDCLPLSAEAADLYTDDFLAGFTLADSAEFDDWQFFQTESLRQELASVLERLVRGHSYQSEFEAAIPYARRWLRLDPLHEPAQRYLMVLYDQSGQKAAALRQYEEYVRHLQEELGILPEEETTTLYEAMKAKRGPLLEARGGASSLPAEPWSQALPQSQLAGDVQLKRVTREDSIPSYPFPGTPEAFTGFLDGGSMPTEAEGPAFVARERELAQLNAFLDGALIGQGHVAFVIGDAGRGKTILVQEFARQAQGNYADLIIAGGNCNAYTGVGDPYLPFREILGLLTGDVETKWAAGAISGDHARRLWSFTPRSAEALVKSGPDLIDVFIPGPALVTRAAAASGETGASDETGWLAQLDELVARKAAGQGQTNVDQSDLFEQYSKVLLSLARQQPVLLVLDDLQWADSGSINLLFHLGRQLQGSRFLITGIFRPDDVALGRDGQRHPLEQLVNEFQRQFGDITIDLRKAEGQRFVEAVLDAEPNQLGPAFRKGFYQHTRGHALFTVEMLRGLQERGDLVRDKQGQWVEGTTLNWDILPARVEGVIGERIGRLPARLQEALKVASVEGEVFTAEVVARQQMVDEREMVRQLSGELDKQHRLVRGQGTQRSGTQRLSHYRFRHILFQRYLYSSLDEVERGYLHETVGNELEQLYGEGTETVAVELARHFEKAGLVNKAVDYLHQAGSRAVRLSANQEAVDLFYKGLALLEDLPPGPERDRQELTLQIGLFAPLAAVKGYGAPELGQAYGRAKVLCEVVGEPDQLFLVLYGLWGHNLVRSELRASRELAAECLALAQRVGKQAFLMEGHRMTDESAFYLGEFARAREHFEQSLALYDREEHRAHAAIYGQDPGVALLSHGCCILWHVGYPDQALNRSREAIALGDQQGHPFSLAFAQCYSAMMHQYRHEPRAVQELAEAAIDLSKEQGFVFWLAQASFLRGWALVEQGRAEEGIAEMRRSLADWRATGTEFLVAYTTALLAEAYGRIGQTDEGLTLLEEALTIVSEKGQGNYEAELYRLKGEFRLQQGADVDEVEGLFRRAIEVARERSAKSQELRATMSLSQLWRSQAAPGKVAEARSMLAEIYGWFSEGFDTADLKTAEMLLDELAGNEQRESSGAGVQVGVPANSPAP